MTELLRATTTGGWWDGVLRMSAASGVMLLAVLALDLLLARRVSARWRAALYIAVFVRVLLPVQWASPLGLLQREAPVAVASSGVEAPGVVTSPASVAAVPAVPTSRVPVPLILQVGVAAALLLAWCVARLVLARSLRAAHPAGVRVRALAPSGLRIVEHATHGPAVFGIFRPRVVVPSPLVRALDDDALAAVLRHEAAHVARRDPVTLALLQVFTFVAWPLLPAWIAAWRVRGLMEQACDEAALREAGAEQRRAYGETLIRVAEWQPLRARLALGMLSFGGGLAPRLRQLRFARRWPAVAQVALVACAVAGVLLASGSRQARAEGEPAPGDVAAGSEVEFDIRAWIVDDAEARAAWPVPDGLAMTPPIVPVTSALSGITREIADAMVAAMRDAESAGHADALAVLQPRIAAGARSERMTARLSGSPHALMLEVAPQEGGPGLAADIVMEWKHVPAQGGAAPEPGSLEGLSYTSTAGSALPAIFAARLGDGRWGMVVMSARSGAAAASPPQGAALGHVERVAAPPAAASSGSEIARSLLDRHCKGKVEADATGEALQVQGLCPAPIDLANLLRDFEDRIDFADVALVRQDNGSDGTSFTFTTCWQPRIPLLLSLETWQVGAADLDRLLPLPFGAPGYSSMTGDSTGIGIQRMPERPGLRVALAELLEAGRATPLWQEERRVVTGDAVRAHAGPLETRRRLELGVTPAFSPRGLDCGLAATWDKTQGPARAATSMPAVGVLTLGNGDFVLVLAEARVARD